MTNIITSKQVKGKGRGKTLGYPTINLLIPRNINLPDGIYGVWVTINNRKILGAMHFGPIPTFGEETKSLEVFLIDIEAYDLPKIIKTEVTIEIIGKIRGIKNFSSPEKLSKQISQDVGIIKKM